MRASQPARTGGFTLLEIMIVVVLIGILATLAGLAVGDGGRREQMRDAANTIRLLTSLAADEAALTSRPIALVFADDQYFLQEYRDGSWRPREHDALFKPRTLPTGITAWIAARGGAIPAIESDSPTVLFPDGNDVRLRIELRDEYAETRIALIPEDNEYIVGAP